jgi:hypothetical protein
VGAVSVTLDASTSKKENVRSGQDIDYSSHPYRSQGTRVAMYDTRSRVSKRIMTAAHELVSPGEIERDQEGQVVNAT